MRLEDTTIYKDLTRQGISIHTRKGWDNACVSVDKYTYHIVKITIGGGSEHPDISLWHEGGHANHPLGLVNSGKWYDVLTRELAADAWVFANYDGEHPIDLVINQLRESILTYTNGGDTVALDKPDLVEAAKTLGICDLITWVTE